MYDWLKKNQKKLLAVIGAFLMVSFLISVPLGSLTSSGNTRGAPKAHVGKNPIYAYEFRQAEVEWRMLEQAGIIDPMQGRFVPAIAMLGSTIDQQAKEHSDLFLLLTKEAEARGINVSTDVVKTVIQNEIFSPTVLPTDATWQEAVRHPLMVQALRNQLASDAKSSSPKIEQMMVEESRKIRLNLVEFNAEQLSHATTQPTTQQVQTLYNDYKNVQPDLSKPAGDVLGFGYEVPDRVKLQYVTISHDEVLKAAEDAHRDANDKPGQLPYDLQVKGLQYYLQHQSEFVRTAPETKPSTRPATAPADTQPATQAATQPTTALSSTTAPSPATLPTTLASTMPAAPAAPTTRPFTEVQEEIVSKLLKDETADLEKKIADSIHDKLTTDGLAWNRTHATALPTTGPTTQPQGYPSYAYLEGVAQAIEREFKVLPEITQIAEWSDSKALDALPGIGSSRTENQLFTLAAFNAAPFAMDPARKSSGLQIWQPSEIFSDLHDNDYIFRLTDASPAHAPELEAVLARVQEDARLKNAYDHAQELAAKFVAATKGSGFNRAALDDALPVISTGELNLPRAAQDREIPNFKASMEAEGALVDKAGELLAQASPQNPNPVGIIPMPTDKMVAVVQLAGVSVRIPQEERFLYQMFSSKTGLQDSEKMAKSYFAYDAVVKRLEFKMEGTDKSGG